MDVFTPYDNPRSLCLQSNGHFGIVAKFLSVQLCPRNFKAIPKDNAQRLLIRYSKWHPSFLHPSKQWLQYFPTPLRNSIQLLDVLDPVKHERDCGI